jgi:mRNA interferase MazF
MNTVTVAPITTTIRGLSTEVALDTRNGLDAKCVVACDHITTVPADVLDEQVGRLLDRQESDLSAAIHAAFDLD